MLPPAVGVPAVRRELDRAGPRRRGRRRRRARRPARGAPRHGRRSTPSAPPMRGSDERAHHRHDPRRRAGRQHRARPRAPGLPRRPPHRRHPRAAGRDGHGGVRRGRRGARCPATQVTALEDVELQAPFKFYRDEPRTLEVRALVRDGGDGSARGRLRLVGRRTLAGQGEQETRPLHRPRAPRRASRRGAARRDAAGAAAAGQPSSATTRVYRVYFHGPGLPGARAAPTAANGDVLGASPTTCRPHYEPAEPADASSSRG